MIFKLNLASLDSVIIAKVQEKHLNLIKVNYLEVEPSFLRSNENFNVLNYQQTPTSSSITHFICSFNVHASSHLLF